MPITLNIIADDADDLVDEFRRLNALTSASMSVGAIDPSNVSTDVLIDLVRERLRADGFKLEVIDQRDQNPPSSPPETAPEAGPQPEPPEPIEIPAPKAKKARKANGAGVPPETITEPPVVDEDPTSPKKVAPTVRLDAMPDPEEDRQHVMDTLGGLATKSKLKSRVFDFAGRLAKQHGKDKLSELPADPFPVIRAAMEKEFADDLRAAT